MVYAAFAGCAHIHTPKFVELLAARQDVRIRSVWDHDTTRAARNAAAMNARVVADLQDICADPKISAVVVCCETNRHEQVVREVVSAKKHLFVEKPLGTGSRDAYAMAEAIERAGVIFQTGYMMRGLPAPQFVRRQIQQGGLGKVTRVRSSVCHSGALKGLFDGEWRWMADVKQAGCGAFGDLGTHGLDLLIWLMGEVQIVVAAAIDNGTARYPQCDETGEALLRFKNGTIGTLAAAWDDVANPVSLLVSGTAGHVAVINDEVYYVNRNVDGADGKRPWNDLPAMLPHPLDLFFDAVTGRANVPLVTPREAAYRCAVMEAIYESARTGTPVEPRAGQATT